MPDETSLPPREVYSIVVSGAMNPRIHHPQWYRAIGAIDEAGLQSALSQPLNIAATYSQFQFGTPPVVISCQPEFWQIQFTDDNLWPGMLEMVSIVFARLNETPVAAYAMTTQVHKDTLATDVKALIARALVDLNFGFPTGKSIAVDMTVNATEPDCTVAMSVQSSLLSERAVYVFYQCQYSPTGAGFVQFELGALLKARIDGYREKSRVAIEKAISALNAMSGK